MTEISAQITTASSNLSLREILFVILVAGFGFLVDVYDSVLFAVVRIASLKDLGIADSDALQTGVLLLNMQMTGMILGGFIWGVLGDKKGRKAALFGSILLYSLANLLNSFVTDIPQYAVLRFLSGIGLAGEVGAAMTIVAEVTPRQYRTYGTVAVSVFGVLGAILASVICGGIDWRVAFLSAGLFGLALLLARISMREPPVFEKIAGQSHLVRGSIKLLFSNPKRALKLLYCVTAGLPVFFTFGVLVTFAPEVWIGSGDKAALTVASLTMNYCIGEMIGEVCSGGLSQAMRSRKKVIQLFLVGATLCSAAILYCPAHLYGILTIPLGFLVGYWGILITAAAEQFGTNLRSTATTVVPNLMRATVIPMNLAFGFLCSKLMGHTSALILGAVSMLIAFISVALMEETFGKDLDFVET